MSELKALAAQKQSATQASGILQRKCSDCRKKRQLLQRRAVRQAEPDMVPSIVHEVLRTPGQPLDAATREFMERRFGHDFSQVPAQSAGLQASASGLRIGPANDSFEQEADQMAGKIIRESQVGASESKQLPSRYDFSQVRVHSDAKAAESARSVNARAYTVGHDVVFGPGQYAHGTSGGQRLLAHELTHVVQQSRMEANAIQRLPEAGESACTDNERASQSRARSLVGRGTEGRGRTFGSRLTPAENLAWASLTPECQQNSAQCLDETSSRLSRLHGRIHAAMDVQAPRTTPIYAPIRGRVLQAENRETYGNVVMLLHNCPPHTEEFGDGPVTTIFAHMDSIFVSLDQDVQAGVQVGTVGDTGEGGVHLHFSVQHVPRGGPPRRASSPYEERPQIRINPHDWLTFTPPHGMGIPVATARIAEPGEASEPAVPAAPAETQSEKSSHGVLQRSSESPIDSWASERARISQTHLHIQRKPSEVTAYTFLGTSVGGGVNPTMQARLTDVASHLETRFNAIHGRAPIDAQELREWAGVSSISGWRQASSNTSKHCSGSAVDVNYWNQPYIVTRTTSGGSSEYGGELAGGGLNAQRQAAAEVYDRAVAFVFGDSNADVSARRPAAGATPRETTSAVYGRFRHVSDALSAYLSLAFHTAPDTVSRRPMVNIERVTEEQLLRAISTTERKEEATAIEDIRQYILNHAPPGPDQTYHWNWEDSFLARDYYFRMLRDYEHVRIPMVRGTPTARPPQTRNPARGFLDMTEEFVVAMADVGGLRWGIADFGAATSGDTHHFDLGNDGGVTRDCSL